MKHSKERLSVTGKMTEKGADLAGILLAVGASVFLILSGVAVVLVAM